MSFPPLCECLPPSDQKNGLVAKCFELQEDSYLNKRTICTINSQSSVVIVKERLWNAALTVRVFNPNYEWAVGLPMSPRWKQHFRLTVGNGLQKQSV